MDPRASDRRARRRRLVRRALLALAAAALALSLFGLWLARVQEDRFERRRGALVSAELEPAREAEGHTETLVTLRSSSGLVVRLALKRPVEPVGAAAPRPLIVLLGGQQTGLEALRYVGATRGTIIAVVGYPYEGPRKPSPLEFVLTVPSIRAALLDTPPAVQLALDWLLEQPGVDRSRVELCGVSLGGPFACVVGGIEPRFTRVWSIHGTADLYALLDHSLATRIGWTPARKLVALVVFVLADAPTLEPERYVGRIAPRPFVMLNAEDDERLPREAVLALYAAAGEPRELVWLPGRHIEPKRVEIVRQLVDLVLTRVTETAD